MSNDHPSLSIIKVRIYLCNMKIEARFSRANTNQNGNTISRDNKAGESHSCNKTIFADKIPKSGNSDSITFVVVKF